MRALRVVGLTEDGEVVLEDPVRLERFRVPADERLSAAARGDLSRLGQIAIELESQLRPREIQARIRAGASVEQVAAAAGVPEQKIERFAYPVLLERFRTAENAQRAHPVRADGPDNRTLAEVVAHTFGLRGQGYEGARWDSWKGEDGRWVVALGWRAGRSDNRAHWTFQPGAHGGTVTALDEHASDLVEGLPARPLRTVGAVVDLTRPEEEPPTEPSPVEQWRAAASDSYRERLPHPDPRPSSGRTAPEPWRPAPPAQRQAEQARPTVERERERPAAEWTGGAERREPARREPGHAPAASATTPERAAAPAADNTAPVTTPATAPAELGTAAQDAVPAGRAPAEAGNEVTEAVAAATTEVTEPAVPEPTGTQTATDDSGPTAPDPTDAQASTEVTEPAATTEVTEAAAPEPTGTQAATEVTEPTAPEPTEAPAATSNAEVSEPTTDAPAPPEPTPAAATPTVPEQASEEPPVANRRTRKGKPVMPSWDEVLLGVRGPR